MINKSVLFACAGYGGGIGKMLRFVMGICLNDFGHVSLLHRGRESENDVIPEGVEEIKIPFNYNRSLPIWRLRQINDIRREIKRCRPDVVCCFGSEMAVMVAAATIGLKVKLILAERGDPYTFSKGWARLARWAFNRADNCVFQLEKQCHWYGDQVMKKSTVIPNAFIPTGEVIPYEGKRKETIVSVGRFVYEKRYEILIEAFKIVHERFPQYQLVIYGEGPYQSKYEQMIKMFQLEDAVIFPGYTTNAMGVIHDASVFVLPSLYEGIPNTLIEALAIGVPTVSTDCTPGGPDFLTDHGRRGLLVPVNDAARMAEAICRILETPQLSKKLSQLGQEIVPLLEKERIASLWSEFFRKCL